MSEKYIPLYRKYRPQTFYDLIGQEHITTALSNAIELKRISHAYLFCGPRGTGKTSSARILAKSLNCSTGPTLKPCGTCPSCVDIINSNPMDVIEIDAASNRGIEDTQKILEKIQYVPVHGKYKIYVIDEVHMLSTTSFNALLKTLEEPPENVIFIFATTEPQKVLETIISRCQRFDFKRITTGDIVKRLKYIADTEKIKISENALINIAKNSAGGMRDSLSLLDQVSILDVKKEISVEDIESLLGKISNDILFEMTEQILSQNTQGAIKLIDAIYNKGNEPSQVITNLIQYLRNLLVIKNTTDIAAARELTQLSDEYIAKIQPQTQKIESAQVIFIIEKLSSYLKELRNTTNRYLWHELCIIDITTTKFVPYDELLQRIEKLEAGISNNCMPAPKKVFEQPKQIVPERVPPAVSQPVPEYVTSAEIEPTKPVSEDIPESTPQAVESSDNSNGDTSSSWRDILENIDHTPSRVLFSSKGQPVEINANRVVVTFANEIFVTQAKDATKLAALQSAVDKYFQASNVNVQIRLKQDGDTLVSSAPIDINKKKIVEDLQPIEIKEYVQSSEIESEVDTNNDNDDSDANYDEIMPSEKEENKEDSSVVPNLYSDQVNLAMNLFSGKFVD